MYLFLNVFLYKTIFSSVGNQYFNWINFNTFSAMFTIQANQTGYLEEYQPQTKLPINLWIDDASTAYLSPLIYILGLGEIALKWNGEMIGVRHIR